jgi:hypothetical protein
VQTVRANETTRFANVPPGRYRVACWHERLPGSEQLISLSPDKWSALSLNVAASNGIWRSTNAGTASVGGNVSPAFAG